MLFKPFLERNEALFGIRIDNLLKVEGIVRPPSEVYRNVEAERLEALH